MLPIWGERGVYIFYFYVGERSKAQEAALLQKSSKMAQGRGHLRHRFFTGRRRCETAPLQGQGFQRAALGGRSGSAGGGGPRATGCRRRSPDGDIRCGSRSGDGSPLQPSQAEIDEHEAHGRVNYRSWCPVCVAARGLGQQRAGAPQADENAVPRVV